MGVTTVIELDHDRAWELLEERAGVAYLIDAIRKHLMTGLAAGTRIPVGRIVVSFHRDEGTTDKAWQAFLKKLERKTE